MTTERCRCSRTEKAWRRKAGHDLTIDVGHWDAVVEVGEDGALAAVQQLNADPHSLQVREGLRGVKGIKPYRGMMGALKVRDTVEVVVDVPLPAG